MNQFLTTKTIAREALPILESNLVFPALIYKDFSEDFSKQGDTIQVRKPPVYNAAEFDGEIEIQDINEGEVLVKLDKIADVSVELSAKEMALNAEDFTKRHRREDQRRRSCPLQGHSLRLRRGRHHALHPHRSCGRRKDPQRS